MLNRTEQSKLLLIIMATNLLHLHFRSNLHHLNKKEKTQREDYKKITFLIHFGFVSRETREGWPLLTVETEVNGDSKSTQKKGVLP